MPKPNLDVYIETQNWPSKRGAPKPTLVITLNALLEICERENSIFGLNDGPRFAAALAEYARDHLGSDLGAVTCWREDAEDRIDNEDDDAGPLCPPAGREDLDDGPTDASHTL